ncbi:hypothetical protein [Actinomycetospora flava]|uniref:Replication protein n=1 Tax=Actinomycetospora flava TaxID=3129232 RepID=A0ABU8LYD0_9PSEU
MMLDPEQGVTLAVTTNSDGTRTAGYSGLASCGSVWACPQCAAKIATRRADELSQVMRAVDDASGSAFLLTLTMRHSRGDRLGLSKQERARLRQLEDNLASYEVANANRWSFDERQAEADAIEHNTLTARKGCWDVLSDAWAKVTSGAAWKADQELFGGLLGWARVVEVTDGENGWHVHIHALLCFREQVSADMVAAGVGARMFGRWRRALERKGFDASDEHGWDLRRVQLGDGDLADYFTKIAHEVTGSHRKGGRRAGGRTPMQLLADAVDSCEGSAAVRWREWEQASEGRRQLTWSVGRRDLRALAGLGEVAPDDEVAREEHGADSYLVLHNEAWALMTGSRLACDVLAVAELGGLRAVRLWCREQGIPLHEDPERDSIVDWCRPLRM